ncbi:putative biofilm-associated protein [Staphylococcus gallinarum]|uniref:Putative biofilm-associated protein n=1 Tax=Staphylococcus gallinarum TaxID=1293 RepID=A0A380FPA9_STAGA|nr:putative biofilm-associated protein [Staphylococcus gallinarum]
MAPTVSEVTSESTQVTGTGEPGSTVKVELPDGTELTGVADDQGNYTIDLPTNKKIPRVEKVLKSHRQMHQVTNLMRKS